MDDAELRKQERALIKGIAICMLAFAVGMALWLYNEHTGKIRRPNAVPPPKTEAQAAAPSRLALDYAGEAPALPAIQKAPALQKIKVRLAAQPGPAYVHRNGSVLRDRPKSSGHALKKEARGAKLTVVTVEEDGWAKVSDGALTGYMRASVLGVDPPA
jgi:hypothetical protein